MSGPGGATTKRDNRRLTRREQYQQRQLARQRERQRQLRNQRILRGGLIGGGALVVIVAIVLLSVFVFHIDSGSGNGGHSTALATFPPVSGAAAEGKQIDNMQCATTQGSAQHLADYLKIYVNGQQMTVPPGVGAPGTCFYPLRVKSGAPNAIQVLSPDATRVYTLGEFFDVWGQPLSATQVGTYKADTHHKLVYEVFDANGKLSTITSDPRQIALVNHDTIVILYNSSNVHPTPYTNWTAIGD